ncbi:EAL domain-containing protein [Sporosarcina gallistercoris]|uniref:EAL domain-containing protein n=1 Tax=Sporosarcina gallistercoris TaxID=2762245 RepID=A0ABR8PNB8_9BACL|nr:EAL domain-containing protein [Sporosarcina gallistercoris]MBD7909653.1 EAL domain-containing protein [Sporosarcina gallistercoris]
MPCRTACIVTDLQIEVKIEDLIQLKMLTEHMERLHVLQAFDGEESSVITVTESGLRDLTDFARDYLDVRELFFRVSGENHWRPLSEVEELLTSQWIDDLIQQERVISYYQPIVDTECSIYGYELLARFHSPEGQMIYPDEAFAAARARGRLYALDRLCRITAVRHAAPLINQKAFINFVPTSIYSPEFCLQSTVAVANQFNIDPYQLVFEVVETDQVEDVEHLKTILRYYREKGFHYALDDVGEGYSTVELLSDLQPHYMKLDRSFVDGVALDPNKQEKAKMFLTKAKESGSVPLAEGIEQEEDFKWLKERGYQLFQGYFFGKPAPSPL